MVYSEILAYVWLILCMCMLWSVASFPAPPSISMFHAEKLWNIEKLGGARNEASGLYTLEIGRKFMYIEFDQNSMLLKPHLIIHAEAMGMHGSIVQLAHNLTYKPW